MSQSSKKWLREHFSDSYVQQAKQQGWRSRAAFKLLEMVENYPILKPGLRVVDLGAAPGGWSQVAQQKVRQSGTVIALDILPMPPIPGVEFLQGDFTEQQTLDNLVGLLSSLRLEQHSIDTVLSDMAPNTSGIKSVDQPRMMALCEMALSFCHDFLRPGGSVLMKAFQGQGFQDLHQDLTGAFQKVVVLKPRASRARSKEVYLLGSGYTI